MNPIRHIQKAKEFKTSPDFQKLLAMQEHPTFREICRFLEHMIARTLPDICPDWYVGEIEACIIKIEPAASGWRLITPLYNSILDHYALIVLRKLDFDTPCSTAGDIVDGKLGSMPTESIRRYGKTHKNQILDWLASTQYCNTIINADYVERVRNIAAGRGHDGGGQ
jgi:hypothetical protein